MDGWNWYLYAANEPVMGVDPTGNYRITIRSWWSWAQMLGYTAGMAAIIISTIPSIDRVKKYNAVASMLTFAIFGFGVALSGSDYNPDFRFFMTILGGSAGLLRAISSLAGALSSSDVLKGNMAFAAVVATTMNSLMICGALLALEAD